MSAFSTFPFVVNIAAITTKTMVILFKCCIKFHI